MDQKIQYSLATSRGHRDGPPIVCLAPVGALRLGMVTTCVHKARDGHHVSVLWTCWVWALRAQTQQAKTRDFF